MTTRIILGATLVALIFASDVPAQEPLKSGPQVGARNNKGGFFPQFVAGPGTGERRCPV